MTELEATTDFEGTDVDGIEQEDYEEDGGFENDIDINGEDYHLRGRGRGAFRLALP